MIFSKKLHIFSYCYEIQREKERGEGRVCCMEMSRGSKALQVTLLTLFFAASTANNAAKKVFNVVDFGAIPVEKADNAQVRVISIS